MDPEPVKDRLSPGGNPNEEVKIHGCMSNNIKLTWVFAFSKLAYSVSSFAGGVHSRL